MLHGFIHIILSSPKINVEITCSFLGENDDASNSLNLVCIDSGNNEIPFEFILLRNARTSYNYTNASVKYIIDDTRGRKLEAVHQKEYLLIF